MNRTRNSGGKGSGQVWNRRPARRHLQDTAAAPQSRRTRNRRNHRRRHRLRTPGSRTGQVPRQRRGVLPKQRKDRAAAESRTAEGNRPRPEETDQGAANRTLPGLATPQTRRTQETAVPRTRAAPEYRARCANRIHRTNPEKRAVGPRARTSRSYHETSDGANTRKNGEHLETEPSRARSARVRIPASKLVVRHVIIFGHGHGLQRAIIDESQHRTPERLIMAQH